MGRRIAIGALKAYTRALPRRHQPDPDGEPRDRRADYSPNPRRSNRSARAAKTDRFIRRMASPWPSSWTACCGSGRWMHNGVPAGPARQINHEVTDAPTWSGDSKQLLYLSNGKLRMISRRWIEPRTVPLELTWTHEAAPARDHHPRGTHVGWTRRRRATDVDIIVVNGRIQSDRTASGTRCRRCPPSWWTRRI